MRKSNCRAFGESVPLFLCSHAHALQESVAKAPTREKRENNSQRNGSGSGSSVAKAQVPFKHYHILRPTGNLLRDLRGVGVNFSQEGKPAHEDGAAAGRIDDEVEIDSHGVEWKLVEYGAGVEDGVTELTLRGRDAESLESGQKIIADALSKADQITRIGYMTFPDRGAFPRVIGSKGAVINDLSAETDSEIIVPRDDTTIKIYGMYSRSTRHKYL